MENEHGQADTRNKPMACSRRARDKDQALDSRVKERLAGERGNLERNTMWHGLFLEHGGKTVRDIMSEPPGYKIQLVSLKLELLSRCAIQNTTGIP